jgi:hypothetical protein
VKLFRDFTSVQLPKGEDKMEYLNDLINAAQSIREKGFDVQAFLGWKEVAFLALLGVLGPLHYYTRTFKQVTAAQDSLSLLAGEGILMAAKEEILNVNGLQNNDQSHFVADKTSL